MNSLDFTFNRFVMKLFKTTNINVVEDCRVHIRIQLPSERFTVLDADGHGVTDSGIDLTQP